MRRPDEGPKAVGDNGDLRMSGSTSALFRERARGGVRRTGDGHDHRQRRVACPIRQEVDAALPLSRLRHGMG